MTAVGELRWRCAAFDNHDELMNSWEVDAADKDAAFKVADLCRHAAKRGWQFTSALEEAA